MKAPSALAAVAALVAILAAGGCSTSYEGGDKDEFIAQGNAICEAKGATVKPALEELIGGGRLATPSELRSFVGDVAQPALQERVVELRKLEPPTEDRDEVDAIIRAYRKAIDTIVADPMQLADADPFLEAYNEARSYGLTSCAG